MVRMVPGSERVVGVKNAVFHPGVGELAQCNLLAAVRIFESYDVGLSAVIANVQARLNFPKRLSKRTDDCPVWTLPEEFVLYTEPRSRTQNDRRMNTAFHAQSDHSKKRNRVPEHFKLAVRINSRQ